jgi:hypothetical protein
MTVRAVWRPLRRDGSVWQRRQQNRREAKGRARLRAVPWPAVLGLGSAVFLMFQQCRPTGGVPDACQTGRKTANVAALSAPDGR